MSQRSKIFWRCRRGIREMDILLQNYLELHYNTSSVHDKDTFEALLDEADLDILAWITEKTFPDKKYVGIIETIRGLAETAKIYPDNTTS